MRESYQNQSETKSQNDTSMMISSSSSSLIIHVVGRRIRSLLLAVIMIILIIVVVDVDGSSTTDSKSNSNSKELCVDDHGVFIGLATDEDAYTSISGSVGTEVDSIPQSWILTSTTDGDGPKNSYDGQFLQVLPDSGRTYPTSKSAGGSGGGGHGHGGHDALTDPNSLEGDSPYVSFQFKVTKDKKGNNAGGGEGIHTLFIRWTGGDTVGGGDSFFVVLYKLPKNKKKSKELIHGQQTVKPAVVPIDAGMSKYAGCCYDMVRFLMLQYISILYITGRKERKRSYYNDRFLKFCIIILLFILFISLFIFTVIYLGHPCLSLLF